MTAGEKAARTVFALQALISVALASAACSVGAEAPGGPTPPTIDVALSEYRFEYSQPIPAGRVVFRIYNAGTVAHRFTLVRLPESMPPLDAQLHGQERMPLTPFAGVPERFPTQTGTFAVNLAPGDRYGVICLLQAPDGEPHALKGMNSEFRAGSSMLPTAGDADE